MRYSLFVFALLLVNACKISHGSWNPHEVLKEKKYTVIDLNNLESDSILMASQILPRNIIAINNHCSDGIYINGVFTDLDSIEYRLKEIIFNPLKKSSYPRAFEDAYVLLDHFYKADTCGHFKREYSSAVNKSIRNIHVQRAYNLGIYLPDTIHTIEDLRLLDPAIFLNVGIRERDLGIAIKLPPWTKKEPDLSKLKAKNVLDIHFNANNEIRVRGELTDIENLSNVVEVFIMNPNEDEMMSEDPTKALIVLDIDHETKYESYLKLYDEITKAYIRLWNAEAQRQFGQPYDDNLSVEKRKAVRDVIPKVLSEKDL